MKWGALGEDIIILLKDRLTIILNITANLFLFIIRIIEIKKEERNELLNRRLIGNAIIIFSIISILGKLNWLAGNRLDNYSVKIGFIILIISLINGVLAVSNKNINKLIHVFFSSSIVILGLIYINKSWEICSSLESGNYQGFYEKIMFVIFIIISNLILIFIKRSENSILMDVNKGCLLGFSIACFNDLLTNQLNYGWGMFSENLMIISIIISIISYFYIKDEINEIPMILLLIPAALLNAKPIGNYNYGVINTFFGIIFGRYVLAIIIYFILLYLASKEPMVFMKRKRTTIAALALLIFSIAICTLPLKIKIEKDIECIEWKTSDEKYSEDVTVTIKGTIVNYILFGRSFIGDIIVDKYDFTHDARELNLDMDLNFDYVLYLQNQGGMKALGWLCESDNMEKISILVYDGTGEWPGEQGIVISGPAQGKDEAVKVGKEVTKDIQWIHSESENWK